MSDSYLGIIAASTLVMALVQVGVLIGVLVAIKRVKETVDRLEHATRPLVDHVDRLVLDSVDAIRSIREQVDRVEDMATDVLTHTDQAVHRVQSYLLAPARQTIALAAGARALFGALGPSLSRAFRSGT